MDSYYRCILEFGTIIEMNFVVALYDVGLLHGGRGRVSIQLPHPLDAICQLSTTADINMAVICTTSAPPSGCAPRLRPPPAPLGPLTVGSLLTPQL